MTTWMSGPCQGDREGQQEAGCFLPPPLSRACHAAFVPRLASLSLPYPVCFPLSLIYEPWNAPESVQKAAKCIIGVDYPRPIVNHAETSRLNIERMKQIYQQLSRYRGLCLLASVPSCVEDLSHPVAEPGSSQAGSISNTGPRPLSSGPASPKRKLEAAEEPPGEELSKRARVTVTEMPAQEPPSKDS